MSSSATYDTIAIVGVGLIGGSIGKAALARGIAQQVIGIGRRTETLQIAAKLGLISEATTDLRQGVAQADLIVVCTPVGQIVQQLLACAEFSRPGTLLTDAGSTKASIVAEIEACMPSDRFFVGSHPLAGNHASGPEAASADLFVGRRSVVTPTEQSDPNAVVAICQFWERLGAVVSRLSPTEHDAVVALTSHVPHLLAAVMAGITPPAWLNFTGSGWRDTTRIAAGNVDLWVQIVSQNRGPVIHALDKLAQTLDSMRTAIVQQDDATLKQMLEIGKTTRDAVAN